MDNQHKHIKGYRDLSQAEIDAMNAVKDAGVMIGVLVDTVASIDGVDQQWLAAAKLDLQKGFMCLTRSIAQPTTF
jgi:molybdate-binding protein